MEKDPFAKYVLDGHDPVPEPDPIKWGIWFETADRHVANTRLPNGLVVSTVFLGLDHAFWNEGPPILFETMVFDEDDGAEDDYTRRYATWDDAAAGHAAIVALVSRRRVRLERYWKAIRRWFRRFRLHTK